jgi:hypothetical protein
MDQGAEFRRCLLGIFVRWSFLGNENISALVFFVGGEDLFLVVAALGVDFPWIEVFAAEQRQGGVVAGEHGVILIVVAVQAVYGD